MSIPYSIKSAGNFAYDQNLGRQGTIRGSGQSLGQTEESLRLAKFLNSSSNKPIASQLNNLQQKKELYYAVYQLVIGCTKTFFAKEDIDRLKPKRHGQAATSNKFLRSSSKLSPMWSLGIDQM